MKFRWIPLPRGVIALGLRLYRRTEQAELGLISAGVAFFGFLAIFPAVAALIATCRSRNGRRSARARARRQVGVEDVGVGRDPRADRRDRLRDTQNHLREVGEPLRVRIDDQRHRGERREQQAQRVQRGGGGRLARNSGVCRERVVNRLQ